MLILINCLNNLILDITNISLNIMFIINFEKNTPLINLDWEINLFNYTSASLDILNNSKEFIFQHWVFINELLSVNDYLLFLKNNSFLSKAFFFQIELVESWYFYQTTFTQTYIFSELLQNYVTDSENSLYNTITNLSVKPNLANFYNYQYNFIKIIELFFLEKVFFFLSLNTIILLIIIFSLFLMCKSTNLIYTLISFLVFTVTTGFFSLVWGAEYIGLCIILIYGAAIPVLALYIIMLVNVDLIQWLFFIESIKSFSFIKVLLIILTSLIFSFISVSFFLKGTPNSFTNSINYNSWCQLEIIYLIKWYMLSNSISFGFINNFDLSLFPYFTDIDKVASAAFKVSYNELFALVLLLLIAIIVVLSISRTFDLSSNIYENSYYNSVIINNNLKNFIKKINLQQLYLLHREKKEFFKHLVFREKFAVQNISKKFSIYLFQLYFSNFNFSSYNQPTEMFVHESFLFYLEDLYDEETIRFLNLYFYSY